MLTNYLKIAFRSLARHRGYTFINVTGLAVGLACCLLITAYVRDELRYDRHHVGADRIYRVHVRESQVVTPTIVAPLFRRTFPEVEAAARLYDVGSFRPVVVGYGDRLFQEQRFLYADSTVFDVFTLPLVAGNAATALARPATIVLSRSMARKYFGDEDPLGKTLQVGAADAFEVTGVMEDFPATSHVQADFLASFTSTRWADVETWGSANFLTYVRLRDAASRPAVEHQIAALLERMRSQGDLTNDYALTLVPLTDLHLHFEGRITYIYLFSAIAALILLVACINYMNLATARSARRAREVGMRKVLGAYRSQLAGQFFGESALLAGLALATAMLLAQALLPAFSAVSGKRLELDYLGDPFLLVTLAGLGLVVTFVAGSYPALMLSAFEPARVLKGSFRASRAGAVLRKGLVVFQFAVSVFLIVGTIVVYEQLAYVQSRHPGFDKEQVVVLPIGDTVLRERYPAMKAALTQLAPVRSAAAVNSIPGYQRGGYALEAEGLTLPEGEIFPIRGLQADKDVVATLGLELLAGPGFPQSESYTPEQGYVYLVNEATARALGWTPEAAVGKRFNLLGGRPGEVVGVVRDFHHSSLREAIDPLALFIEPGSYEYLLVKVAPGDLAASLDAIRQVWTQFAAHRPFTYQFLDQEFDALYRSEERLGQLFTLFAALAILIACLGLFGLAAFSAEQRTKEIGVRKVLGASVPGIVALLSKEFTRLVAVGFVLAAPLAYLVMDRWLHTFVYRTDIGWTVFVLAGATAFAVAFLTVSYQAVKAATTDPVKALRYE